MYKKAAKALSATHSADDKPLRPRTATQIADILTDPNRYPSPVRPVGAASGNPRCTRAQNGTQIELSRMNQVISLNRNTVTVEAGMRLRDLARYLSDHNRELVGGYEEPDRSIGGAVSSGCLSAGMPDNGAHLASTVSAVGLVLPDGRLKDVDQRNPDLLAVIRQSYGLLGVIHSITLATRRSRAYAIRHRKVKFADLSGLLPELATTTAGVKLFLLPFRGNAFVELREASDGEISGFRTMNWKVGDWAVNRALPNLVHSLGKSLSVSHLRDPLIDGFSSATQMLARSKLIDTGSNALEQTSRFRRIGSENPIRSCTWMFPAARFYAALYAYRAFCQRYYRRERFRCDLPAICYRLIGDQSALLSPSFDGAVFALEVRSTVSDGWHDFLMDFSELATQFDGIPCFGLTQNFTAAQAHRAYGNRRTKFAAVRRKLDPKDRLLNQYFCEFIG